MDYIGIDPGVRESYLAIIKNKKLIDFSSFKSDVDSLYDVFNLVITGRVISVIERPDRVDQKSTLEDILLLMGVVGRIEGVISYFGRVPTLIKPLEWKGQTKKHVTKNRVLKRFPEAENLLLDIPESKKHNYYDAIGIAMYCEKRFK